MLNCLQRPHLDLCRGVQFVIGSLPLECEYAALCSANSVVFVVSPSKANITERCSFWL